MTVGELIERLRQYAPNVDAKVRFSYNYGDHGRTQVAVEVTEVSAGVVRWSDYVEDFELLEVGEDFDDVDELRGTERAVVLR